MSIAMTHAAPPAADHPAPTGQDSTAHILQAIAALRFGEIAVTIHDGRVVQVDVTEKRRFAPR